MKKNKILVTGGAGFIGSHLTDALVDLGHSVTVVDNLLTGKKSQVNKAAHFVRADIKNLKAIKPCFKDIDFVFHLAARARIQPSIKNPVPTFEDNVLGTLNVLLAARDADVRRVIYSASSSSYGDQPRLPLVEKMKPNFKNPYAISKYVGEELCRLFSGLYGLETVSLRYFNVYGPRQLLSGAYATVVGIFLKQLQDGKPLTIVGDGTIRRDFTHVSDIVRANILAMESERIGAGEVLNIGTGKNFSINEVAAMVLNISKGGVPGGLLPQIGLAINKNTKPKVMLAVAAKTKKLVYIPPRPGETKKTLADIKKAAELLNWQPAITLKEGLANMPEKTCPSLGGRRGAHKNGKTSFKKWR